MGWGFMHWFFEMGLSIGVFYGWGMEWKMRDGNLRIALTMSMNATFDGRRIGG